MSTKHSTHIQSQKRRRLSIWLPVIIVVGLALIVVAVVSGNSSATAASNFNPEVSGAPRLTTDKEKVDLGTLALGQTVEVKFEVTNTGDKPLNFTDAPYVQVVKGCCAPTPVVGTQTLMPGQHTTVSVPFMMHQGMGGYHDFRLHLLTNDPSQLDKTVQILSNWQ